MIARTEIEVSITGAIEAEQQLQSVADAEREVGTGGARASTGVDKLASSMRAIEQEGRSVSTGLGSVSSSLDGARDRLGSTLSAFNDLGDAFRLVGAGLAGGALFGGFADIAEVVGLMGDKFGLTALRVDQMVASQRTLSAELVARKFEVEDLGDAVDRYAHSLGLASQAQLTFRERQEALRKVAAGEVTSMELQDAQAAKLTDALAAANQRLEAFRRDRVAFISEVTAAGGERQFEAALQGRIDRLKADLDQINRTQLGLLGRKGADPLMDAVRDYGSSIVERAKVAVAVTKVGLQQQAQQWSRFLADTAAKMQQSPAGAQGKTARAGAAKPEQTLGDIISGISGQESPLRQMETAALSGISEAGGREDVLSRLFGPSQEEQDALRNSLVEPLQGGLEQALSIAETLYGNISDILAAEPEESPFSGMLEGMRTSVSQMAAEAQNVGGIMSSVVSTFTSGVGTMVTNLIVAGEAGAKSVRKTIGQALAGISAQAFGYATLLAALGTAASLGLVGLPAAPGLFSAAGVMAAAGTALALSARAMGASGVGASSGGSRGGGARGGESTPSAASTAPRSDRQSGPQPVIVYIGEDVVTRGVTSSARRQDMRGGIAEPRLAVVG